ncbi:aminotransferase class I/II-fold pyridoxal phosphate-dependent enzyme [Altererythrobacter salegens]|uniref:8-amino-7-oxononanoate synthase n=1 Tax=Croceibacterium salegens TaxID=1737568 RepID=A0A6I4SRT7_9SPHN|nr:8-amino-7-oxononanoate synthase [Croceibacterium salegens]MXO58269.1 aminotransferase class I/II-fold pyridoxal phosphate-dependent enzyme [Croceibacterium salegens]
MLDRIAAALAERKRKGLLRTLRPLAPGKPGHVVREGRELIDLSSNDYLGLTRNQVLMKRCIQWTEHLGTGSRASRLVTGTLEQHAAVEAKLAAFKGSEAALLFASGWQANASIFKALVKLAPGTTIFADEVVHASMHLGIAAAGKRQVRFPHNDLDELDRLLAEQGPLAEERIIVTESVFSMDGDRCDLVRLTEIARHHDAFLIVDEAHATGVLGPRGAGLSAEAGVDVDLVIGTFSKALGSFGAYVAGSQLLCDYLVNACSGLIYSTALPPPVLGAIDAALDLVPGMDAERAHLAALADRLRKGLQRQGFDTADSDTQIVPLLVGGEDETLALARRLEEQGVLGVAIRPPTVPPGTARIRFALSCVHHEDDIDCLLEALGETV